MLQVIINILIIVLLAILGGVPLILLIRAMVNEDFRKSCEKFERERKQGKQSKQSYPSSKQFDKYYKTGKRRYLYDADYKGD